MINLHIESFKVKKERMIYQLILWSYFLICIIVRSSVGGEEL